MRLVPSFHLSFPDVRALRIALASGAVAGLVVVAACTDTGGKTITAPSASNLRNATIASGGFGHAKLLTLCVSNDVGTPGGTYTFRNIKLNRSQSDPTDGPFPWTLDGNGIFPGDGFWYDVANGGGGSTSANADVGVNYTLGKGDCVDVLTRTSGDPVFMASIQQPAGPCNPADPSTFTDVLYPSDPRSRHGCGGVNDTFAAANVSFISNTLGAVFDHVDCTVDDGDLMPQHVNPTTGNPPVPITPWPQGGFNGADPAFANYGCGTSNSVTRGFTNFEHGTTITYAFHSAPILTECTAGPDAGGSAAAAYYGVSNARTTAAFNESEVLTGFALTSGVLHGWYTDEHAMTLGVDSVFVKNKNPTPSVGYGISTNPSVYAIATMTGNMTGTKTAGFAGSPFVPEGRVGTPADPLGLANAIDPAGRPLRPGLYFTDITADHNLKTGDWQMGNDNPVAPTAIYGTWKAAIITIDNTKTPSVTSLVNRSDPQQNHKVVGPGGTNPPASAIDNGYSTDNQWTLSTLVSQGVLVSGHAYRAQFIVHDGDQNKSGGDVGQACVNIQM